MNNSIYKNKYLFENDLLDTVAEIVNTEGLVNIDEDDVAAVIEGKDKLYHYDGLIKFDELDKVTLDCDLELKDMILYVEAGVEVTLKEIDELIVYIKSKLGDDVNIIYGCGIFKKYKKGEARIFILAA